MWRIKTIECLCLETIGLMVASWKFEFLNTSIFVLALLLRQIFVLRTSNFGRQLVADSSSIEILYYVLKLHTRESLGELEKAVETLAWGSCSHSISHCFKLSTCVSITQ